MKSCSEKTQDNRKGLYVAFWISKTGVSETKFSPSVMRMIWKTNLGKFVAS